MPMFYPKNKARALASIVGVAGSICCGSAHSETFQNIQVTVRGSGLPVLMIPGLYSAAAVWDETCEQLLSAGVQCHIVQLPGFAGQPATSPPTSEHFLDAMRDRLLAYIAAKNLKKPVLIGHSLGGVLVLKMALKDPGRMERLIIVDALPYFPAARDPRITVADMQAMAEAMRLDMLNSSPEVYERQIKANLIGMTRSPEHMERLVRWGLASDRATTVKAMYEMFITDLRAESGAIPQPTLVLGAWAGFAAYGSTQASMHKIFAEQYSKLKDVRIELSDAGHHFLMWDDGPWLVAQIKRFIEPIYAQQAAAPAVTSSEHP